MSKIGFVYTALLTLSSQSRVPVVFSELSVKYNITPKNIHNWKTTFLNNAELAMEPSKAVSEYKENEKQLIAKLDVK